MIFFVTVQDGEKTGVKTGIKLAYKQSALWVCFCPCFHIGRTSDCFLSSPRLGKKMCPPEQLRFYKFIHHPPMADLKRLDFRRLFLFEDFPYTVFYIINQVGVNIFFPNLFAIFYVYLLLP